MPTLAQLGSLPALLPNSLLSTSPLWKREVKSVRSLDLALFLRLHKGSGNYLKALREVDVLKNAVMQAHIDDALPEDALSLMEHTAAHERLSLGEFVEWLEQTTLARRRAILFCLETEMNVKAAIDLTWRDLRQVQMTEFATELVRASVRHIRLPYVFWDTLPNGAAAPLFGLQETALEVSQGLGINVLRRLYRDLVPLDPAADLEAFLEDVK